MAPTPEVLLATLACIAAAACYGVSTPLMKRATKHMEPLAIAAGIHPASLVVLLPGALWSWLQARFTEGAMAALLVRGDLGLAYWLHVRVIRHVDAGGRHEPWPS